jgi:hypothetical protein
MFHQVDILYCGNDVSRYYLFLRRMTGVADVIYVNNVTELWGVKGWEG